MPLPVLHPRHAYSPSDLLRLFGQTEHRWTEHMAEAEPLDFGTAYANPKLNTVYDANCIRDVSLPEGVSPQSAYEQVLAHYQSVGTRCAYWTMNPSMPDAQTRPMIDHLRSLGHRPAHTDIMLLSHAAGIAAPASPDLKIIPARASFRHAQVLAEESARQWNAPQLAEARMTHLDDPHFDALLALKDQVPVGYMGVLALGEIGRIEHVYVAEAFRRQHIGRTLLVRALEICARSLFKHVMLAVRPGNAAAIALYRQFGFERIGQITSYHDPQVVRTTPAIVEGTS